MEHTVSPQSDQRRPLVDMRMVSQATSQEMNDSEDSRQYGNEDQRNLETLRKTTRSCFGLPWTTAFEPNRPPWFKDAQGCDSNEGQQSSSRVSHKLNSVARKCGD